MALTDKDRQKLLAPTAGLRKNKTIDSVKNYLEDRNIDAILFKKNGMTLDRLVDSLAETMNDFSDNQFDVSKSLHMYDALTNDQLLSNTKNSNLITYKAFTAMTQRASDFTETLDKPLDDILGSLKRAKIAAKVMLKTFFKQEENPLKLLMDSVSIVGKNSSIAVNGQMHFFEEITKNNQLLQKIQTTPDLEKKYNDLAKDYNTYLGQNYNAQSMWR